MKRDKLIIIICAVVILCSSLTYFAYYQYNIIERKDFKFDFQLENIVGFNLDPDKIHFGAFRPGTASSTRTINLTNNQDIPIKVVYSVKGLRTGKIDISENDFILNPGDSKELTLVASAPAGSRYGNYSGTIVFLFKRV